VRERLLTTIAGLGTRARELYDKVRPACRKGEELRSRGGMSTIGSCVAAAERPVQTPQPELVDPVLRSQLCTNVVGPGVGERTGKLVRAERLSNGERERERESMSWKATPGRLTRVDERPRACSAHQVTTRDASQSGTGCGSERSKVPAGVAGSDAALLAGITGTSALSGRTA
jgi:hypothetical protein